MVNLLAVLFSNAGIQCISDILGAVSPDLLPMENLAVTAGFTLGYVRLPVCGYSLVNYPRGW